MKSVYLCGFMGCGKSHIGRQLAKLLGCDFVDLDSYIEQREGMTIAEIFEKHGEPYFRNAEAKYIREMPENCVVATGGGAIINPNTAEAARNAGKVVFLDASFATCYARIKGDTRRPLVMKNTPEQLEELYNARRAVYRKNSSAIIGANGKDSDIVSEIVKMVK